MPETPVELPKSLENKFGNATFVVATFAIYGAVSATDDVVRITRKFRENRKNKKEAAKQAAV